MKREDIIRKLTSRKLWAAIGAFVAALCVLFGVDELTTEKLLTVLGALGVLLGYILTEGSIDRESISENKNTDTDNDTYD